MNSKQVEQMNNLRKVEQQAIREFFGKRNYSQAVDGFRYLVRPVHGFFEAGSEGSLPEVRVHVQKRCVDPNGNVYFRFGRSFNVDLLQLRSLKSVSPADNA